MYTGTLAAASNKADWKFTIEFIDPDTNDTVDLTGATIKLSVRHQTGRNIVLGGSTSDGKIALTDPTNGECQVWFTPTDMSAFNCPGTYDVGLIATLASGVTYQILAGQVPIVDGIVE